VFGLSMFEESPWARLNSYESDNVRNRTGYANPEMDAALNELKLAVTREEKKAAMANVQEIWNETVPTAMLAAVEEFIINDGTVHGVIYSRDTTPMFHDAYIE
jgi:peptide/nickel transport system substrate-binding protein